MFSVGVVLCEPLTNERLFEGNTEISYMVSVFKKKGTPNLNTPYLQSLKPLKL